MYNIFMTTKTKLTLDKSIITPLALCVVAIVIGLNQFFSQWAYSEDGHNHLLFGYLGLCGLLFLIIRIKKAKFSVPLIIIMAAVLFYADQKFEWRKTYITDAKYGRPFPLMPYIDNYPTYEDHLFWFINDKPRYIKFTEECFEPALNNQQSGRDCNSSNQIYETYKVRISSMIDDHYQKMKYTAQQIEAQVFQDISEYEQCLRDRQCAIIPLLPIDAGEVDELSNAYSDIRNKFWSLINDETISAENCDFFDLCRAMKQLGVYSIQTSVQNTNTAQ